jgi:hypothetical protein
MSSSPSPDSAGSPQAATGQGCCSRASKYHRSFKRLSSPSIELLPPGNYLMWVVRDGSRGESFPVDLGPEGELAMSLDLEVP